MLNRISTNLNFYDKFTKIWDSFGVKDKSLSISCVQKIKNFAWLLFIVAKLKIFSASKCREDITETAFLLHSVIRKVILTLPVDASCELFDR